MSDTPATDRMWQTTVYTGSVMRQGYIYEHLGPAEFKIDGLGHLRIEVYPENSDFEVVIALHLAGSFVGVSQQVLSEDELKDDPDEEIQVIQGDGSEENPR